MNSASRPVIELPQVSAATPTAMVRVASREPGDQEARSVEISAVILTSSARRFCGKVTAKLPTRPKPSDAALEEQLLREIRASFDAAGDIVGEMAVGAVFKGVTYETLVNPDFQQLVKENFPAVALMDEFDAARQTELSLKP